MANQAVQKKTVGRRTEKDKERIFKGLSAMFADNGMKVRREELKRGPGWSVSNGSCRKMEERLVFVDRRSPIDDQIAFLVQAFIGAGLTVREESLQEFSEETKNSLLSLFDRPALSV